MLLNFKVENFKSFKDCIDFSMEATKLSNLLKNVFTVNNISLLKTASIYGANAGGKSNLTKAMLKMKNIIKNSFDIEKVKGYKHESHLLNSSSVDKATIFEVEFIANEIKYRYGFEIDKNARILEEWLFSKKLKKRAKEITLFKREKKKIELGALFKEGKGIEDKIRDNSLFLVVVANFNGKISKIVLDWFNNFNIISNLKSEKFKFYSFDKLKDKNFKDKNFKDKIVNMIKDADIDIYDIINKKVSFEELEMDEKNLKKIPQKLLEDLRDKGLNRVETVHMKYDKNNSFESFIPFNLSLESDGTQKLLALSAPIIEVLLNGEVLVIDELENSMHTILVEKIIELFNSQETNPNNAQLIFTTHNTKILNQKLFRRDQIWFAQKDIYGCSELYSLIEYGKGTRNDANLEKKYLEGKFGAKPDIDSLNYME